MTNKDISVPRAVVWATLDCGHERVVGSAEEVGNPVGCADCGYRWRTIVELPPKDPQ